jgi:hypothetical protein
MAGQLLWKRNVKLIARSATKQIEITGLRMRFDCGRDGEDRQNKSTIWIYNLSEKTRAFFTGGISIELFVGYGPDSDLELLITGDMLTSRSDYEAPEWVTELQIGEAQGDSERIVSASYSANTSSAKIISDIVNAMQGIKLSEPVSRLPKKIYQNGFVAFGPAMNALRKVCGAIGRRPSIVNGVLYFLDDAGGTVGASWAIGPDTGLIGAPSQTENGLEFKALINPYVVPGSYVLTGVKYTGDTHENVWEMTCSVNVGTGDPEELDEGYGADAQG